MKEKQKHDHDSIIESYDRRSIPLLRLQAFVSSDACERANACVSSDACDCAQAYTKVHWARAPQATASQRRQRRTTRVMLIRMCLEGDACKSQATIKTMLIFWMGKGLRPHEPTQGSLRPVSWPLTEINAAPLKTNVIS